ncbi:MAG: hypothetical protein ABI895_01135 [Deltaproteobacteria bacterium]
MLARLLFVLTLLGVGLRAPSAQAYPWMIRHGFAKCGSCHVDPMGGETLTGMGRVMGETLLAMPWGQSTPSDAAKFLFGVSEPAGVYLGGSLRGMNVITFETGKVRSFPMQADLTAAAIVGKLTLAGSLGVSRASSRYEHSSKARLLGNVEDEGFLLVSRNYWLGYRFDPSWMLRLGRLNLPFGIRTPEHTLWARSETLTDRESDQQHGASVVYAAGRLRAELMLSLGNFQRPGAAIRERGYVGYAEYWLQQDLALGLSSEVLTSRHELNVDQGAVLRQAHGLTLRYVFSQPVVLLAEADALKKTGAGLGYVGLATFDVEPWQGLHFAATAEVLDRGEPTVGSGLGRGSPDLRGWLTIDWFFGPHLELRSDLVWSRERGEMLQTQLHIYL